MQNLVIGQEAKSGAQAVAIDEGDDGMELLEAILERSPRQDQRIRGLDRLYCLGGPGLPILELLG